MEHITVCICTFKRPELLTRLLDELARQETGGLFNYSVVVADNDREESAKAVVTKFSERHQVETIYCVEPTLNIALARNKAASQAKGDYLAFIDDDEFPAKDWLQAMLKTIKAQGVAGVLGPVKPHFDVPPPDWVTKAGFYDRPTHKTGFVMSWPESRTGNVLLRRQILDGMAEVFRPEFGTGGEDQDFFRRMMEKGHKFIWCNEAPVYETVPPHRWERRFLLKRALLRGKITCQQRRNLAKNIGKSIIAVPLYGIALPFLLLLSHHNFMKCLVRLFDHLGRLLALLSLNPVKERSN